MGVVHGLESYAGVIAVEIAVLHKIFDCIDHLLMSVGTWQSLLKLVHTFFNRFACSSLASSTGRIVSKIQEGSSLLLTVALCILLENFCRRRLCEYNGTGSERMSTVVFVNVVYGEGTVR